ncbi:uncharacterized protein DDB_G0289917-like [Eupeodes corollae]|uniref:uncharacterized protein DDB_G0289917-like n=1 Tax=Eupeodes corollae TaxID=290404 RepID=UPI00249025DD|nr:uncharacterized protein DDB_G0289917-like [Eupeodes corollae]
MAQLNVEQCLEALTQIIIQNNNGNNFRARIEKEIRYLNVFTGDPGTLPSFASSVNKILANHTHIERPTVYEVIHDTKIQGAAKNILYAEPPTDWNQCLEKLRRHFRPSKDEPTITKNIGSLRVSSILELDIRLKKLTEEIAEIAAFSENGESIVLIFNSMLVQKAKELAAGALAHALADRYSIGEVRDIINKFIGQDQGNLKQYYNYRSDMNRQVRPNHFSNNSNPNSQRNFQTNNFHNNTNKSGQHNLNNSGMHRNRHNQNNLSNNPNSNYNPNNPNRSTQDRGYNRRNNSGNFRSPGEPMDTLSASYQRQVNLQDSDFQGTSLQADYPI